MPTLEAIKAKLECPYSLETSILSQMGLTWETKKFYYQKTVNAVSYEIDVIYVK